MGSNNKNASTLKFPRTACFDFDGTICEWAFPGCGRPRGEIIRAMKMLKAKGWRIIIYTSRVNAEWPEPERTRNCQEMIQYLVGAGVTFDRIWGIGFRPGTYIWSFEPADLGKPVAHVYVDDRAVMVGRGAGVLLGSTAGGDINEVTAELLVEICSDIAGEALPC